MNKALVRFITVALVGGMLTLWSTVPAFAKGPPSGVDPATRGLCTALSHVVSNIPPGHPGYDGTHYAALTVGASNPAVDVEFVIAGCA